MNNIKMIEFDTEVNGIDLHVMAGYSIDRNAKSDRDGNRGELEIDIIDIVVFADETDITSILNTYADTIIKVDVNERIWEKYNGY